jgi:predicted TIM-barrel fold metal-dependent hydrolase
MDSERALSIIRAHGTDRVFFGTDSPMWNHVSEWARFNALGLTDEERRRILWENAAGLLL